MFFKLILNVFSKICFGINDDKGSLTFYNCALQAIVATFKDAEKTFDPDVQPKKEASPLHSLLQKDFDLCDGSRLHWYFVYYGFYYIHIESDSCMKWLILDHIHSGWVMCNCQIKSNLGNIDKEEVAHN